MTAFFQDTVLYYLREMLVIGLPAAIVFCCFWPYRRRALEAMGLRTSPLREAGLVLFIVLLFGVLAAALWPVYLMNPATGTGVWGSIHLLTERPSLLCNVNLIPLRMFADYWQELRAGGFAFTLLNLVGNLAVFVPLGFFPVLLWRGGGWRRALSVGLGTSVFIECGQYFLVRTTDIDDVILNTLGALCGYWSFLLLRRLAPRFAAKFRCERVDFPHGRET